MNFWQRYVNRSHLRQNSKYIILYPLPYMGSGGLTDKLRERQCNYKENTLIKITEHQRICKLEQSHDTK